MDYAESATFTVCLCLVLLLILAGVGLLAYSNSTLKTDLNTCKSALDLLPDEPVCNDGFHIIHRCVNNTITTVTVNST